MKIVHLGETDSGGGAAHAMTRLHDSLLRAGVDSHLLVRTSAAPSARVQTQPTRGDADELAAAVRTAVVRRYVELNRTPRTNTHFSLQIDGADASGLPQVASSAVVHLHWTASFQTPSDVRHLLGAKPVVWTLHDLEPLTGGCHFPAGCTGFADACEACPQLVRDPFRITATTLRDKATLWTGARPTFVAPSRSMAGLARSSAVVRAADAAVVHIPYGVDVDTFRPRERAAARRALGLPADGAFVLCGSNYNAELRKGMQFVEAVFAAAATGPAFDRAGVTLLTVGEPKLDRADLDGARVVNLGRVAADVMPAVYAAADVFLHLSIEDNFPLMVLESLSCGTPVVAFDVGGVPDVLIDEVCGRLVPAGDAAAMAAALASLLRDGERLRPMSARARAHIEGNFNDADIARRYADLYAEVALRPLPIADVAPPLESGIEAVFPRWSAACLVQELTEARAQAVALAEESRAKSDRIAAAEREAGGMAADLAAQDRLLQEQHAELITVHAVAAERKVLAEKLHASAAHTQALADRLRGEVRLRDDRLERLEGTIEQQHSEIELVHHVADDRRQLIEELHRIAEERAALIDRLSSSPEPSQEGRAEEPHAEKALADAHEYGR